MGKCGFQGNPLAVLYVATTRLARSPAELEILSVGLDVGFSGSKSFDALHHAAVDYLGTGDPQPLTEALLPFHEEIPLPGPGWQPPDPGEFIPEIDPCLIHPTECLDFTGETWLVDACGKPDYVINEVTPIDACEGEVVCARTPTIRVEAMIMGMATRAKPCVRMMALAESALSS